MAFAPQLKVAVIGAGVAGLATARHLKDESHEVVVFEKSDKIGGLWVYDPRAETDPLGQDPDREIIHSSLYPSLKANLPKQVMGFLDYPFKTNDPNRVFPGHEEVLEFINDFAEDFGLIDMIRFNTEVVLVERVGPKKQQWVVQSRSGDRNSEEVFDAVVVCTGHVTKPRVAQIPELEKWTGKQLHSHNYRGPEPFQDKVVVVIGLAASGIDISREIAKVAKEVHISVRRKPFFKVETWGDGNVRLHSEIYSVNETGEVGFYDRTTVHPDIILHCTGYEYYYPFLKTDGIVTVDDNRVGPLYKHILSPILAPRLSFIGLNHMSLSIPVMDMQAKWLSRVLSGKVNLSKEDMLAEIEKHYNNMRAKELPKRHTHYLGFEACVDYMNSLATEAGLPLVDDQIRVSIRSFISFLIQNSDGRLWKPDNGNKFDG